MTTSLIHVFFEISSGIPVTIRVHIAPAVERDVATFEYSLFHENRRVAVQLNGPSFPKRSICAGTHGNMGIGSLVVVEVQLHSRGRLRVCEGLFYDATILKVLRQRRTRRKYPYILLGRSLPVQDIPPSRADRADPQIGLPLQQGILHATYVVLRLREVPFLTSQTPMDCNRIPAFSHK